MLFPIKPICSKSKARKDGTSIIFLQYCGPEDKKTLLNTEIAIPPKFWIKRSQSISEDLPDIYGIAAVLNDQLTTLLRKAEDIIKKYGIDSGIKDTVDFVKVTFSPDFDISTLQNKSSETSSISESIAHDNSILNKEAETKKINTDKLNLDIYVQFDDYMKVKKNKVSKGMMKIYEATKETLLVFEKFRNKKISFEFLDYDFYVFKIPAGHLLVSGTGKQRIMKGYADRVLSYGFAHRSD